MRHAAIVPLVGGAAIGASKALGGQPEYIASWPAFAHNDHYCRMYYPDVPYYVMQSVDSIKMLQKVDIVTCVPPCSGLSTATPSTSRGCQAPQNEHMLIVADFAMQRKTPAILIENAPALYSAAGEPFARRFLPLCKQYGYQMMLIKTSSILHGLPQNRVRSFVVLFKGAKLPEWQPIKVPYKPLYDWNVDKHPTLTSEWRGENDELVRLLLRKGYRFNDMMYAAEGPRSMWNIFIESGIKYRFKEKPYRYMQQTQEGGSGIMDRSPIFVAGYSNALMWKSAHRMLNPATDYTRQFSIRELMNLMGLPKDFAEIPAKDINVLFQNVPVNTVATMVEQIAGHLNGSRWYRPKQAITRYNNIKQTYE